MQKQFRFFLMGFLVTNTSLIFGRERIIKAEPVKPVSEVELQQQQAEFVEPKWRKNSDKRTIFKPFKQLTIPELEYNLKVYLRRNLSGDKDSATRYLERLITKYSDFAKIRDARMQLADLYFELGNYERAGTVYTEYFAAYPGHKKAEHALWRSIVAKHKSLGACDQDNSVTQEVLELAETYLKNSSYKKYRKQLLELMLGCKTQLFESEIQVIENYFKQGRLTAVERRLNQLQAHKLIAEIPQAQARLNRLFNLLEQAKEGKNPIKLLKGSRVTVKRKPVVTVQDSAPAGAPATPIFQPKLKTIDYARQF